MRDRLIADCASDPPLSATERALAVTRSRDVLAGLAAAAARHGLKRHAVAVRHADSARALSRACAHDQLRVEVSTLVDAWPPALTQGESLPASSLVEIADELRRRPAMRYVTIAGAVHRPLVLAAPPETTVRSLVARAGGARPADWMAIAGGLPGGHIVSRDTRLDAVRGARLLLVLSSRHPLVRRLRLSPATLARRRASLCAGPRACLGCELCATTRPLDATLLAARLGLSRFEAPPIVIETL